MSSPRQSEEIFRILNPLIRELQPSEVVTRDSTDYALHTQPFSIQRDLQPPVAFAPNSTESLSRIVKFLYSSGLDFNVRGHGLKSPSAHDTLISMVNFKDFSYDDEKKLVTIGIGATWSELAIHMEKADPEYTLLFARTPHIGIGGCILLGGFSWLSTEKGCISDPASLKDAEVVKYDGSVVMASDEPDLLWALRGGGGGFGVVTKVVLQAHHYSQKLWSGNIIVPRVFLPQVARGVADFAASNPDPSVSVFLVILQEKLMDYMHAEGDNPGDPKGGIVILQAFDSKGEAHAREVLRWAFELPGAIDNSRETDMMGVLNMQRNVTTVRGTMNSWWSTMGLPTISYETIMRTVEWYDNLRSYGGSIYECTYLLFETLTLGPYVDASPKDCAWPRPHDLKHIILIGTGCKKDAPAEEVKLARQLVIDAPAAVLPKDAKLHITPPGLEDFHDPRVTYGAHFDKLVELRKKYDPEGRFKGLIPHT